MTTHYNGIAVLMILPDNRYVVKSADFCRWPLDKDQPAQQDYYYLDALFQDALEEIVDTTYETLGSFLVFRRIENDPRNHITQPSRKLTVGVRHGLAARCEAWLRLAVHGEIQIGLRPWYGLWPVILGRSPNQGLSPLQITTSAARHSHASHQTAKP